MYLNKIRLNVTAFNTLVKKFKHRIELINKIAAEEGKRGVIGKVLQKNLFRTNHLAFNMSDK